MTDPASPGNDFLSQLTAIVDKNLSNEQFGVSELADAMNMSRSNLLRKVKKLTTLSVSQLISQVRLQRGMELLKKSSLNVSEVSHQVGFSSTSYFIKSFREYYGYPPGEVRKREAEPVASVTDHAGVVVSETQSLEFIPVKHTKRYILIGSVVLVAVAVGGWFLYNSQTKATSISLERSIAVLPFKNDSNDSTNVYLINGLMESTLNNLQQIKDLRVISRTSTEKYRNVARSMPEMAKELNVSYIVEGSGQKMGDRILLNIQLIEAATDKHLWGRQYRREAKDIFELQQEVAKDIADEISVIITPDEVSRIEKKPTEDLVAYDLYLQAMDIMLDRNGGNLRKGIGLLRKAIARDNKFALAYAQATFAYSYLDIFKVEKKYTDSIDYFADHALLYDPKLDQSLVAKAVSYFQKKGFKQAEPYLEKALEYNPNSMLAISMLSDFYANYVPNTSKYLQYALMGVRHDVGGDSSATSYNYLRLGNALVQLGFVDESLIYLNRSLDYNPNNPFTAYVKAFVLYAKDRNGPRSINLLLKEFNKDTTRYDILQDIGKLSYLTKDWDGAYKYYRRFMKMREFRKVNVYQYENLSIALVMRHKGFNDEADKLAESFKAYMDTDHTIYKNLGLAGYYEYKGDFPKALEHMKLFSKEENYWYWILLWDEDPSYTEMNNNPEVKKVMAEVKRKFWAEHDKIKASLEEKGLLPIAEPVKK